MTENERITPAASRPSEQGEPVAPYPPDRGDLRKALGALAAAANAMLLRLPAHWHDDATIELTDAASDARAALSEAEQNDLYEAPAASRPAVGRASLIRTILLSWCHSEELVDRQVEDQGCGLACNGRDYRRAAEAADAILALLDPRDDTRAGGDQAQKVGGTPITKEQHQGLVAECERLRKVVAEKNTIIGILKSCISSQIAKIEGDSLDAICEVVGEGSEFATYNKGKSAMRGWFMRRLAAVSHEISQKYGDH